MIPRVTHTHTLMDMRTDLTAVPRASLRNPNPEKSRKILKGPGGLQEEVGPKAQSENEPTG